MANPVPTDCRPTWSCSFYSNSDLRNLSVFASPALSRRRRNVYKEPNQYWMLREAEVKEEDPSVVSKISQLQQRVELNPVHRLTDCS